LIEQTGKSAQKSLHAIAEEVMLYKNYQLEMDEK